MKHKSFIAGHLMGESFKSKDLNKIVEDYYDLAIYCSSWDKRSIKICDTKKMSSKFSILILFKKKDKLGLRDEHDTILKNHVEKRSKNISYICEESTHIDKLGRLLQDKILNIYKQVKGDLKIFIDISSLPRYYFGLILGQVIKHELSKSVTLFYAEGKYNNKKTKNDEIEFTTGQWTLIKIPNLEGKNDPYKKKFSLVSVGFEGIKTLQIIDSVDPDRIAILFPDPGFTKEYTQTAKKENNQLINEYNISKNNIINSNAGDAIGAWKAINISNMERPNYENTFYLCCGTKPHTLALILNAISKKYPTVMYRLPDGHPVADIEANGIYWSYRISDLSSPPGF